MGIPWRRKPAYEAGKPAAAAVSEGDVEKPAPAPGRDARARSVLDIVKDFQVYLCVFICRPQRLALTHYSRMPPPCQTRRRRPAPSLRPRAAAAAAAAVAWPC